MVMVARRRCVVRGARGGASGGLKCRAAVAAAAAAATAAAAAVAVAVAAEAAVATMVRAQALCLLCGTRIGAATMSQSVARATYMQIR